MARAAHDIGAQAASAGLLALGGALAACAVVQEPPGGPPDFEPPVILSVQPDSGTIADGLRGPLVIRFDEVISETSGGGLDKLVQISPRPDAVEVSWKRTRLEIRPKGGWREGTVYHVTLRPGVADLRNNQLAEGREIVFTTGGEIPQTALEGLVLDWENGRIGAGALIEALHLPDSLVYVGVADSLASFRLTALPPGPYRVFASIDENRNGRRDGREAYDSVEARLDTTARLVLWAAGRDTVGPLLRQVTILDSVSLALQFNQKLEPGDPSTDAASVWLLPDTVPVPVALLWTQERYDLERAAVRDTAAAPPDTAAAPTPPPAAAPPPAGGQRRPQVGQTERAGPAGAAARPGPVRPTAAQDSSEAGRLLASRPALSAQWVLRLDSPLVPGARYLIEARARNVAGREAISRSVLVVPAPRDST